MRRVPSPTPDSEISERSREIGELLARVALRDQAAFSRLYERTAPHLLGVVLRITRHRERAEDILQEVYVNVWKAAGTFDARLAQPLTWLTRIARNRAISARVAVSAAWVKSWCCLAPTTCPMAACRATSSASV